MSIESATYEGNFTVKPGLDLTLYGNGTLSADKNLKFRGEGSSDTFITLSSNQTVSKLLSFSPILNSSDFVVLQSSQSDIPIALTNKIITDSTNIVYAKGFITSSDTVLLTNTKTPTVSNQVLTYTGSDLAWIVPTLNNTTAVGSDSQVQYNLNGIIAGASKLYIDSSDSYPIINNGIASDISNPMSLTNGIKLEGISCADRTQLCSFDRNFTMNKSVNAFQPCFQPNIGRKKIGWWSAIGGISNTTTIIGSAVSIGSSVISSDSIIPGTTFGMTRKIQYNTLNLNNRSAGVVFVNLQCISGNTNTKGGYYLVSRFNITIANNQTWFAGFIPSNNVTDVIGTPSSIANIIGFGKDTSDSINSTYFMYSGSTVPATKVLMTGVYFTSSDMAEIQIFKPPNNSTIGYQIKTIGTGGIISSGTITPTLGTNQPSSTTLLSPIVYVNTGSDATVASLYLSTIYLEQQN